YALVLDRRNRPSRWVHARDLPRATSLATAGKPLRDMVSTQSTLQDALEAMLAEGGAVPVTGPQGQYAGTIHLETVIDTIQTLREERNDDGAAQEEQWPPPAGSPPSRARGGRNGSGCLPSLRSCSCWSPPC